MRIHSCSNKNSNKQSYIRMTWDRVDIKRMFYNRFDIIALGDDNFIKQWCALFFAWMETLKRTRQSSVCYSISPGRFLVANSFCNLGEKEKIFKLLFKEIFIFSKKFLYFQKNYKFLKKYLYFQRYFYIFKDIYIFSNNFQIFKQLFLLYKEIFKLSKQILSLLRSF